MKIIPKLIFVLFVVFIGCSNDKELLIDFSNPEIEYWGRVDSTNGEGVDLFWSGTSIMMNFEGESIRAIFKDESGDNYYNIIIDSDSLFVLRPDKSKRTYLLALGLSKGKHKIEIFKRTEWNRGKTTFYGFQISGDPKILDKTAAKKKKIEFYGNSITAGYAIEDISGNDSPDSIFTNNYLSYSAITARHFDAEYQCICKSGIGIMLSWFPLIMPEMYNRLIPEEPTSRWNFSLYTPDIVVINLFQNDSWLVTLPNHNEFISRFGTEAPSDNFIIESYMQFASSIRKEYPEAHIICALGTMDATKEGSQWPDYIRTAVMRLNDSNIYTHFMPYKNSPGHPTVKEHENMANSLIQFIEDQIEW